MTALRAVPDQADPIAYDQLAEEGVIGACMLDRSACDKAVGILTAAQFFSPAAREVFRVIQTLYERHDPVDLVTVIHELYAAGTLEKVGGPMYVHGVLNGVPSAGSCATYARIVSGNAMLRGIEQAGQKIVALGCAPADDMDEVCAEVQATALEATERRPGQGPKTPEDFIPEYLARLEASTSRPVPGAPTGLRELDHLVGGLKPATLVTIAADSGLGKSSLGSVAAAVEAATSGNSVLVFSLEMTAAELTERMVAYIAAVPLEGLQRGTLNMEQDMRASDAIATIAKLPLCIEDDPDRTTLDIAAACRRQKASAAGLDLVVVDHLGLVTSTIRSDNRPQQISEITRSLKLLSKRLDIPVLVLCQFKKTGPLPNRRPTFDDLKDSSSIRHDSDVVVFIWQPDADVEEHRVMIVAKHRNGRTADIHCRWNGSQARFENGPVR